MDWVSRTAATERLKPSFLLKECRGSDPHSGSLPEPTWVRAREEGWVVLWSPVDISSIQASDTVLELQDPADADWRLTLRFWRRYREFSPLDKARVIGALHERGWNDRKLARELAEELELPQSPVWMRTYRRLNDWPGSLKQRVHQGELSPRLARFIEDIPNGLREALLGSVEEGDIMLSVQECRQLSEASRRLPEERYSDWHRTLNSLSGSNAARENGKEFLNRVVGWANPETARRRERFEDDLESLDLDGRIRVEHPDHFEGDYLEFHFRCRRDQDLSALAEEVKRCRKLFKHL